MEEYFDLSSYKKLNIYPAEISRSSVVQNERASRTILDIWKSCVIYGFKNKLTHYCTCAGTETDSLKDAEIIFWLIKLKNFLHPEIFTPPKKREVTDKKLKSRYVLYPKDIKEKVLGNKEKINIKELNKHGIKLPTSLEYFIKLGGRVTGPPTLFEKFNMFTIPMVFEINRLNEPFLTFFKRPSKHIKI